MVLCHDGPFEAVSGLCPPGTTVPKRCDDPRSPARRNRSSLARSSCRSAAPCCSPSRRRRGTGIANRRSRPDTGGRQVVIPGRQSRPLRVDRSPRIRRGWCPASYSIRSRPSPDVRRAVPIVSRQVADAPERHGRVRRRARNGTLVYVSGGLAIGAAAEARVGRAARHENRSAHPLALYIPRASHPMYACRSTSAIRRTTSGCGTLPGGRCERSRPIPVSIKRQSGCQTDGAVVFSSRGQRGTGTLPPGGRRDGRRRTPESTLADAADARRQVARRQDQLCQVAVDRPST